MSDIQLSAQLKTDLRKCVSESARFNATAHALATVTEGAAYLTATDGRILAIVPTDATAPAAIETYLPAPLAHGKADRPAALSLNGEWRREERGPRGAVKTTALPPVADADNLRFPRAESALPTLLAESTVRLRINANLLKALADAIAEDGAITLLLRPETSPDKAPGGTTAIIAAMGAHGFGAIVPLHAPSDSDRGTKPVAEDCAAFNRAAAYYAEARKAAQQAMLDRQAAQAAQQPAPAVA